MLRFLRDSSRFNGRTWLRFFSLPKPFLKIFGLDTTFFRIVVDSKKSQLGRNLTARYLLINLRVAHFCQDFCAPERIGCPVLILKNTLSDEDVVRINQGPHHRLALKDARIQFLIGRRLSTDLPTRY